MAIDLKTITGLIITNNEEANLPFTLQRLLWLQKIIVIDSGSTDGTVQILNRFENVEVHTRPFDGFANQCNFGLSLIRSEWVLSLDADYLVSKDLKNEIEKITDAQSCNGYAVKFVYSVYDTALPGTIYPPRVILFRRTAGSYESDGHGHKLKLNGISRRLLSEVVHRDLKPISTWLSNQISYSFANYERHCSYLKRAQVPLVSRVRELIIVAPVLIFMHVYLLKGNFTRGRAGLIYALQRCLAEFLLSVLILNGNLEKSYQNRRKLM